jgi:hypothetical protein
MKFNLINKLFKKNSISKNVLYTTLVLFAVFAIGTVVYAASSYRGPGRLAIPESTRSSPVDINEHGIRKCVRNYNDPDIFIPTNQASEWMRFRLAAPSIAVTLNDCVAGCLYAEAQDGMGLGNIVNGGSISNVKNAVINQINAWNTTSGIKNDAIRVVNNDNVSNLGVVFNNSAETYTYAEGSVLGFYWKTLVERTYDNHPETNANARGYSLEIWKMDTCGGSNSQGVSISGYSIYLVPNTDYQTRMDAISYAMSNNASTQYGGTDPNGSVFYYGIYRDIANSSLSPQQKSDLTTYLGNNFYPQSSNWPNWPTSSFKNGQFSIGGMTVNWTTRLESPNDGAGGAATPGWNADINLTIQ